MEQNYADVVVEISHEKIDRSFQYRIPEKLSGLVKPGVLVEAPFGKGNRLIKAYVIGLSKKARIEPEKLKDIQGVVDQGMDIDAQLIKLAAWMREQYGSTMIQALKTVIPVKEKTKPLQKKIVRLKLEAGEAKKQLELCKKKRQNARARLLEALLLDPQIPYPLLSQKLNITAATLKPMVENGMIEILASTMYRNPIQADTTIKKPVLLNREQEEIVRSFQEDYRNGVRKTYLLHGVTGSGKTEVYMEMIATAQALGKQAIVLIPEISLTYQTTMRFYRRFGKKVSIIHSRLSKGERYDQFCRAKEGEVDIMIGPRSALFTPFCRLGLIILDEEQEGAYKSENAPRYHARETAIQRAKMAGASVVLGSATPSLEAFYRVQTQEYGYFTLKGRAVKTSCLPTVYIEDLRRELEAGNKTIISRRLYSLISDRLAKKEQILLFLNRRGYAGFLSCRSCGEAIKCPHCDVSLTLHRGNRLLCHYCGYEKPAPAKCPNCQSPYIAPFGTGTQKVESFINQLFPEAKTLRMDFDTTSLKGSHEKIIRKFLEGEADILIGTQMIVKGHDFPNVTLVGILAADLSLYSSDFRSGERTFQLLTQAAGRAGRASLPGEVVIQTYNPDHYSIALAAKQDYLGFYQEEIAYRATLCYPPIWAMLAVSISSEKQEKAQAFSQALAQQLRNQAWPEELRVIGPTDAPVSKKKDIYYKLLYIKQKNNKTLKNIKNYIESYYEWTDLKKDVMIQFDIL